MTTEYLFYASLAAILATIASRALPFMVLARAAHSPFLHFLGQKLPGAILVILVVYSVKDFAWLQLEPHLDRSANGWPLLVASLVVVLTHLWRRNTLLSIFLGTGLYMFLIQH